MVTATYTISNSYKGGLFMKTYARNVRRAWDGDEYRAPKRFCLDSNTHANMPEDVENEDRLDRVIRESSVTITISSSPSRKNSTIFSGESQEDDDAVTTPPSSPPPQISPIKEKTRKPTFSTLKRKRESTRDTTEPLSERFNSSDRASLPPKKPPPPPPQNLVQLRLDLGQTDTRKSCPDCGMEYVPSNEEDASLHKMYHNMNSDGVELGKAFMKSAMKWSYEVPHIEGSVVVVDRKISPPARKEVQKVLEVVNRELSATAIAADALWSQKSLLEETDGPIESLKQSESEKRNDHKSDRYKMFLHVKNGKCIAACLAERIVKAHRVKPGEERNGTALQSAQSSSIEAEDEAIPAIVGVSRIWSSKAHRRKGIASNLLDCVLNRFIYGMEIDKDELAFSQPTESGGQLARSWYGEQSGWLVYKES